jgi:hypothetical protein
MIWGLDPASKKLAMFTTDGLHTRAVKFTVKKSNRNDELLSMKDWLNLQLKWDPNPIIYCEEPVVAGARNLRSTILIAETVGMVLSRRAVVHMVPVDSWKKGTVGKGGVPKDAVAQWLKKEYPDYAALCGDDQDLIDAAAIYLYGSSVDTSS